MATNDFKPFAIAGGANVISQAAYEALTTLIANGFTSGTAVSQNLNKVWRQSSVMSSVLAQLISDNTGANVVDDGNTAPVLANLKLATAGRALRTTIYLRVGGVQMISVDGAAPTTTGATTFTKHTNSVTADVVVQAGGGGGGGAVSNATQGAIGGGGGGGTCAFAKVLASAITAQTVTVGTGGNGGIANTTAGTSGGTSSIGSVVSAPGGLASPNTPPSTAPAIFGGTGLGSAPTGSNLYTTRGGPGSYGLLISNNNGVGGPGGSTAFGAGPAGPSANTSNGADGLNPGTGGSGCTSAVTNTGGATGGKGADGIIIIRELA